MVHVARQKLGKWYTKTVFGIIFPGILLTIILRGEERWAYYVQHPINREPEVILEPLGQ